MNNEQLNLLLINRFPNLHGKYLDEVSWQEGHSTGSHTVYGDVLTPYLIECIVDNNSQETKRILDYIEEILAFEEPYSDEVIAYSVIESIAYLFDKHSYLQECLGEYTKKVMDEVTSSTSG